MSPPTFCIEFCNSVSVPSLIALVRNFSSLFSVRSNKGQPCLLSGFIETDFSNLY